MKYSCLLALVHINWTEEFIELCDLDIIVLDSIKCAEAELFSHSNIGAFAVTLVIKYLTLNKPEYYKSCY
jgi:hypothetical protein